MDWSEIVGAFNGPVGGGAVMFAVGLFALTGRVVWYTVLRRAEARADRWEALALDLLQTNKKLADATEAAAAVLPVPESEGGEGL